MLCYFFIFITFLIPQNEINASKHYNELLIERKIEKDGKIINRTPTFAVFIAENVNDINKRKVIFSILIIKQIK